MEQKLALSMTQSACRHGYEPLKAQTLEAGAPPDLKEGFLAGEDLAADHPAVRNDPANIGPNQWPPQLAEFKAVMISYVREMKSLTKTLMHGLALSLDLEETYFDDFCRDPILTLRLLHYPPQPPNPAPNEKGCGAHTDWGWNYSAPPRWCRRTSGPACRWLLDLGATDRGHVCGEHRRSFRAVEQQPLSIHGSSGYQQVGARPLLGAVLP